jgi:CopG family nickel-responsive transcriptional regulator
MPDLVRLSLSIERPLFDRLEKLVKRSGYTNRSEFVRDLIRDRLVEGEWAKDDEVLGTITLVYDHHRRQLSEKLTHLQHHHHEEVLVTTHVHLTRHLCAEVILVRANAGQVRKLTDALGRQKGVLHTELSMSSTGASLQ